MFFFFFNKERVTRSRPESNTPPVCSHMNRIFSPLVIFSAYSIFFVVFSSCVHFSSPFDSAVTLTPDLPSARLHAEPERLWLASAEMN